MLPLHDTVRSREAPIVTWLIILANVLVFVAEASMGPQQLARFFDSFGVVPYRLLHQGGPREFLSLFTSMFLHGGWFHLFSNMWALFIFGDNVEDRMGHLPFLVFYLLAGLVAGVVQSLFTPDSTVPLVGASGAISGVMGAYLVLFPRSTVVAVVPIFFFFPWFIELPAVLFIGLWFLSQLGNGLLSLAVAGTVGSFGGVAWWAHVGGFVAGVLLARLFARPQRAPRWYADEFWPW